MRTLAKILRTLGRWFSSPASGYGAATQLGPWYYPYRYPHYRYPCYRYPNPRRKT
jgi:hypothetical protein